MNYYLSVIKKYAVFNGRARRAEYWYFFLFNIIVSIIISVLSYAIGTAFIILSYIYSLALLIPGLAVSVRRLHDIGKSGWWLLISLIPIIGTIWFIILMAKNGTPGENKYGPDPKTN